MNLRALGLSLFSLVSLSACATIVSGTSQNLSVQTVSNGASLPSVNCAVKNSGGTENVMAPGSVNVHRDSDALNIQCAKPGYQAASVDAPASVEPWFVGNILIGGLIGMMVDLTDGAASKYPDTITVPMQAAAPAAPVASAAPATGAVTVAAK